METIDWLLRIGFSHTQEIDVLLEFFCGFINATFYVTFYCCNSNYNNFGIAFLTSNIWRILLYGSIINSQVDICLDSFRGLWERFSMTYLSFQFLRPELYFLLLKIPIRFEITSLKSTFIQTKPLIDGFTSNRFSEQVYRKEKNCIL